MDENENGIPEDDVWMPPELIERARQTALRDANTQEKLEAKRVKKEKRGQRGLRTPPAGRHRILSAACAVLSLLLLAARAALRFWGPFAAAERARAGPVGLALGLLSAAAASALLLIILLPIYPRSYRIAMPVLLGSALLLSFAQAVTISMHTSSQSAAPPPAVNAFGGALLATLLSPLPWLLLGALRRRNTEKFAALLLGIVLGITLLMAGMQLLVRLVRPETPLTISPLTAVDAAQNLFFFLLLLSWPVVSRPILWKKNKEI